MQTLTMQGIADLAQVRRPVVSMWRSRFATSDRPFPRPARERPLRFDAAEVAQWLRETGHGNNDEPDVESSLHSSALDEIAPNLDRASALLLLHHLRGEPLAGIDPGHLVADLGNHPLSDVLDVETTLRALADDTLVSAIDQLAEAAYAASGVLDRLVDDLTDPGGPWADDALTRPGRDLIGAILAELARSTRYAVTPVGSGGLLLAQALVDHLDEPDRTHLDFRYEKPDRPCDRLAWRRLAAHGCSIAATDSTRAHGLLHVMLQQRSHDADAFFARIEDRLLDVGEHDLLVVMGPARLMTERPGAPGRRGLLTPNPSYTAPLRYAAPLPKGLSRYGGRRRLALWVFGRPSSTWTVVGSHSDTRTDAAARQAIAADVAAAVSDAIDIRAHAFHTSTVLESKRFLRRPVLAAPTPAVTVPGAERLARIWELDHALLHGIDLAATDARPATIGLTNTRGLGRDIPGTRLPDEHVGPPAAGTVDVIGPDEVRDPARIGRRAIDRLTLESVAPHGRLTEPGDVVYVSTGRPAAWIDPDGGHMVQTPARVFRCRDTQREDRRLVPTVVAADIAAQPGRDRSTWRLRLIPVDRAHILTEVTRRIDERRRELLDEIGILADLETELTDGLSAGSLTATITPPMADPHHKAAH